MTLFPPPHHRLEAGQAEPLGSSREGTGVNFAIHASDAELVELCLFDSSGAREFARLPLPGHSGSCWHGFLPDCPAHQVYGYRVRQRGASSAEAAAQQAKLLLDPYGRRLAGTWRWHAAHFGASNEDNAAFAYKSRVDEPAGGTAPFARPGYGWSETVIYELHVKGFTARHPAIPAAMRGRFSGLAHPAAIAHLKTLGITAVELLPVMAFVDEPALAARGLRNYWGYNPVSFFAPDPRYGEPSDFRAMVAALHRAGIEVILDVVYNHTAEGDAAGPVYSWRGLDKGTYYRFSDKDRCHYVNDSGCGNSFDLAQPAALDLVLASLRYWAQDMGVDGFRFDLATSLLRNGESFTPGSAFLEAVAADPLLSRLKLIAEPWDLGPDGYRLGGFPAPWREWNDRNRDALRDHWLTGHAGRGELATRLSGSSDLFGAAGRPATSSINYVTSHDGFTLSDLVTYEQKRNHANGEDNRDGNDDNRSCNCGREGASGDPAVLTCRQQSKRALLATLFLSQGVPMLLAGDELGRSQAGNNNAYCQDNETSWLEWSGSGDDLTPFVAALIRLRRAHAQLRRDSWAAIAEQTRWRRPCGRTLTQADWHDGAEAGLALEIHAREPGETRLLLLVNPGTRPARFLLPDGPWHLLFDSATADGRPSERAALSGDFPVAERRLILLGSAGAVAQSA